MSSSRASMPDGVMACKNAVFSVALTRSSSSANCVLTSFFVGPVYSISAVHMALMHKPNLMV